MADPFASRDVSVVIQFYENGGPLNLVMSEADYVDLERTYYSRGANDKVSTWRSLYSGGIFTIDLCAIRGILMVDGNKRQASETFEKLT